MCVFVQLDTYKTVPESCHKVKAAREKDTKEMQDMQEIQKAERDKLKRRLEAGEITQSYYDTELEKIHLKVNERAQDCFHILTQELEEAAATLIPIAIPNFGTFGYRMYNLGISIPYFDLNPKYADLNRLSRSSTSLCRDRETIYFIVATNPLQRIITIADDAEAVEQAIDIPVKVHFYTGAAVDLAGNPSVLVKRKKVY